MRRVDVLDHTMWRSTYKDDSKPQGEVGVKRVIAFCFRCDGSKHTEDIDCRQCDECLEDSVLIKLGARPLRRQHLFHRGRAKHPGTLHT